MASIITIAGEKLFAAKAQANEQLDIDTFIFSNVPGQDPAAPINREEGISVAHQVHQQIVQQVGRINENVVVYSTVMDSLTGPFEFNWVGLYSSVNQTLVAINHIPTTSKTITEPGVAGNTLNRNFGIEYSGIADLTGITVDPETWQLDFTARLGGMDRLTQQLATDMNGKDWFIGDGFKVIPRATANTFSVMPGVGYVSGLRIELKQEHILTLQSYPQFVYVDAWFSGTANSVWTPQVAFTVTDGEMDDYIDVTGVKHYVYKLAIITSANNVEDLRLDNGLANREFVNSVGDEITQEWSEFKAYPEIKKRALVGDIIPKGTQALRLWDVDRVKLYILENDVIDDGTLDSINIQDGMVHISSTEYLLSIFENVRLFTGQKSKVAIAIKAKANVEWFVDPVVGKDAFACGMSIDRPAKTPQHVLDSLPDIIGFQQIINLAEGEYTESSRRPEDMPRPAIIWPQGRYISRRTAQSGSDLVGMIIIKGAGKDKSIIRPSKESGYEHGIYCSGTEIAIQDIGVHPGEGGAKALITSHRGAYIHGRNVDVGGAGADLGLVCEAGGWAEMINSTVLDCDIKDVVVYQTCGLSLAGSLTKVGKITVSGFAQLAYGAEILEASIIATGGELQATGSKTSRPKIKGDLTVENGTLTAAYADIEGSITGRGSDIKLSASCWSKTITMFGGLCRLDGTKSFISPATKSEVLAPLVLREGARLVKEASTEIRNKNNELIGEDYGRFKQSIIADNFVIPIYLSGKNSVIEVYGAASNHQGCTLGKVQNVLDGTPPGDGAILYITGSGYNTEIIESSNVRIPGGEITMGSLPGAYSGAIFSYSSEVKKWLLISVGILIS